ncbi:phosphatase PAP2 family protein [Natrarchaeobius halalkaliphilus]|uniref:Phosphatase PAP2 family protein n=1 Tax=Natrarchaeobius halalkaliphilus TaxID=1679091 RepID=A0A3N6LSL6_9EURY|nr:phosphatase PAP2 family protein [Natrarchaeobius halalkaliphilus]RQG91507.1 phosphatase PAP2 family protein [Natrarchaeobius halalkaliphilus]
MNRDVGVTELIRTVLPEWAGPIFEITALLGDELVVVGVLGILVVVDVYRSADSGSDHLLSRETATLVAIVLGGLALTLVLKTTIDSPRPPASLQAVPREGTGFPSGHTMAATVLWVSLAYWSDRFSARGRLLIASIVIAVVGFSRLALGVHYLVDVVASVGFGVGYLLLAAKATGLEPMRAFATAGVLGVMALLVTAGSADGWLAFVGCIGGAGGWWLVNRPAVQRMWIATTR